MFNKKCEGGFKEYYKNGTLKEVHYYKKGVNVDSSLYYDSNEVLKKIRFWNDPTNYAVFYDENGNITKTGIAKNKDLDFRIGKWVFMMLTSKLTV